MSEQQNPKSQGKGRDIRTLPLQELITIQKQCEEDAQTYEASLSNLQVAMGRYKASRASLKNYGDPSSRGQKMLVPLTGSMYAPGKVTNNETVLVDIGTGFLVRKNIKEADEYLQRKIKLLAENTAKAEEAISNSQKTLESIKRVVHDKIRAMEIEKQRTEEGQTRSIEAGVPS